jgi:two-component system OmpR family sensor kinase
MKRQFIRFYMMLFLSCITLLWAIGSSYQWIRLDPWNYQLDASPLFDLQQKQGLLIQQIPETSLFFPAELRSALERGKVIAVAISEHESLFYRQSLQQGMLDQLGPLPQSTNLDDNLALWVNGALAFLLLGLLWPVFRDIRHLTKVTHKFAQKPQPIQSKIQSGSSLFPLAKSLEQMTRQISQLIQMNQDMSRTIAHETRTPLARMKFTLDLARTQLDTKYQQRMLDDIAEIDALVSNYLDFSQLEYAHTRPLLQKQSMASVLAELESRFDIYQNSVELNFAPAVANAHFHAPALLLAGQNLLANALRYANSRIHISFEQLGAYYQFQVCDDGPGMEEHPDVMMRLFRRGDNSSGFGLGLYIVSKVAEWHQGEVCIQSTAQGTCVSLRWPVPQHISDEVLD